MSDEPNRDHRCRTCEHWGATLQPEQMGSGKWPCSCPIPYFVPKALYECELVGEQDGEDCAAYEYSYRRARLVK
jgi:hypothetical protein